MLLLIMSDFEMLLSLVRLLPDEDELEGDAEEEDVILLDISLPL